MLNVKEYADFTYSLQFTSNGSEIQLFFRDPIPKDFYKYEIEIETDSEMSDIERKISLYNLVFLPEKSSVKFLEELNIKWFNRVQDWILNTLLHEKLMSVEAWLKLAYRLQKNRFGSDLDWFENQPISKILAFIEVQSEAIQIEKAAYAKNSGGSK